VVLQATIAILCTEDCICDPGVSNVVCSHSSLSRIPLIIPTDSHDLLLTNNSITSLEKDSFISRGLTELYSLTMKLCELETIYLGAFNGLTQLTNLTIPFNRISEIIPRIFEMMSRLEYLDLVDNGIEYLEVDVSLLLINILFINLKGNKLQHVHPDMFVGLSHLEDMHLEDNSDLQIPTDLHFVSSVSLTYHTAM
jgi:Leucine-rich repeat (LRR) protein